MILYFHIRLLNKISGCDILTSLYFSKYGSNYITVAREALITHTHATVSVKTEMGL